MEIDILWAVFLYMIVLLSNYRTVDYCKLG